MKVSKKKVLNAVLGLSVLGAIAIGGYFCVFDRYGAVRKCVYSRKCNC